MLSMISIMNPKNISYNNSISVQPRFPNTDIAFNKKTDRLTTITYFPQFYLQNHDFPRF